VQFILACDEIVLAGCIATWYFARDKTKLSHSLSRSIGRTITYHLGSAALGSLLIAIIQAWGGGGRGIRLRTATHTHLPTRIWLMLRRAASPLADRVSGPKTARPEQF
jgi:hypothetical protein